MDTELVMLQLRTFQDFSSLAIMDESNEPNIAFNELKL
jgi:hypothetical protein